MHPSNAKERLIHDFRQLQSTVRGVLEIQQWLLANASLLREVTRELGSESPNPSDYTVPAKIFYLSLPDIKHVGISPHPVNYADKLSKYHQVETPCRFETDHTINLLQVFREIPELGISTDTYDCDPYVNPCQWMVFSPSHWRFAANMMLFHVGFDTELDCRILARVLQAQYPGVSLNGVRAVSSADLFDDEHALGEWLVLNDMLQDNQAKQVLVPDNLL